MAADPEKGVISLISGPMVAAKGLAGVAMGDIVRVGNAGLAGEVIRIARETIYTQVFEDTQGLTLGEPVVASGGPLTVELGPGLLGQTFDGIQRPLDRLLEMTGPFLDRGVSVVALDRDRRWFFEPTAHVGQKLKAGDEIGTVQETAHFMHRVMAPPNVEGVVTWVCDAGDYSVTDPVATLDNGASLTMLHRWPVKQARPVKNKLGYDQLFVTGQRVLDCLFPIPLGGSAIVPGGFGTGKTVVEQTLAKYCNADIIVYVGCGERGNEMADVLTEFPELQDPKTGDALMNRTILVVNTSNMPVAARDASVYTGMTIAEYYRDMGYSVAIMADSTSRWAEALREISSRLEEMPGEEGYPTYLSTRIAEFYERSGRVVCSSAEERIGSLTLVAAVSPPGGDFSEPVTQTSQRVAGALWALDANLAYRRHYPAVNWNRSYSLYENDLASWFDTHAPTGWRKRRQQAVTLMQRDAELQEVVQLVGPDALQDKERIVLEVSKLIRDVFLQQNAFSENDAYSTLEKTNGLLELIVRFYEHSMNLLAQGVSLSRILKLPVREDMARLRTVGSDDFQNARDEAIAKQDSAFGELADRVRSQPVAKN